MTPSLNGTLWAILTHAQVGACIAREATDTRITTKNHRLVHVNHVRNSILFTHNSESRQKKKKK